MASALLSGLLGAFASGGGSTEVINTSNAASDVDVEVSPIIINEVDLSPLDRLTASLEQVELARQESTGELVTDLNTTIRWAVAAAFVGFIIYRKKGKLWASR